MEILKAIEVPAEKRDVQWEYDFLNAFPQSKLQVLSPEPQLGPDGWPYLMVATGAEAAEPALKIIPWLAQRGIGLAVNPGKEYPDFVFNYGMLWNFKEKGQFIQSGAGAPVGPVEFKTGEGILSGEPTKDYLPDYVRAILRDFFRDQGLHQVKIAVVSADRVTYDLVFSLESLGNPPEKEHAGIAEALAWFLPNHYSVMLLSETSIPGFVNL